MASTPAAPLAVLLQHAAGRRTAAGVDAPRRDAELLVLHVLGRERAFLYAHPETVLTAAELAAFDQLLTARARRVPTQYLTGTQEFYGRPFRVTPAVLIPRPETELVVEMALERLRPAPAPTCMDVGTGSGCIAITLALERRDARVAALDRSWAALAVARDNARHLGAAVDFCAGDLLAALRPASIDLVIANPPYVARAERAALPPEVRDHEPDAALFAGPRGDEVFARLVPEAARVLRPGGWLVLEIGANQGPALRQLLAGWVEAEVRPDLQGLDRVVVARQPGRS